MSKANKMERKGNAAAKKVRPKMKLNRVARKPERKTGKGRKQLAPKNRKPAIRLENSQQETFDLHDEKREEWRGWQEKKAVELQRQYSRPLDVPPIVEPEKAEEKHGMGLPHFATAVLIGFALAASALAFSMLVLKLDIVYSSGVAIPVFVAFTIMANDLIEKKAA